MKKALFSAIIMIMAVLPAIASDFEVDGIAYIVNLDHMSVTVTDNNYSGDVEIPENVAYKGVSYTVTEIGNGAFLDCSGLTSVKIPNTVISIGNGAFDSCHSLTSIFIPSSVTFIGAYAFQNCSALAYISVDNENAVYDSRNHCNAIIEKATNKLIAGCMNSFIPETIITIDSGSFSGHTKLESIAIPNSVKTIGSLAFKECKSLKSVIIGDSVTSIGNLAFAGCESLTNVLLPNSVTFIGNYAFLYSENLKSVTIPDKVTFIGDYAFFGCNGLTNVFSYILRPDEVTTGTQVFTGVSNKNCMLHIPSQTISFYRKCEQWNYFKNILDADNIHYGALGDLDVSGMVDVDDVNAVINIILGLELVSGYMGRGDMDCNGVIDVDDVNAIVNVILENNIVDLPEAMSVTANYDNIGWETALDMVQVYGAPSVFWHLVYINEKGVQLIHRHNKFSHVINYSDINVMGDRASEIFSADGKIASNKPGWYLMIVSTSLESNKGVYNVHFNNPEVWLMGPVTPRGMWEELEDGCKFAVPDGPDGEFVSPVFSRSVPGGEGDGVRAYVKIASYNWWKSEFMVYNGKIEYRGMGEDQNDPSNFGYRVAGNKGQCLYFNFTKEVGKIE